MAGWPLPRYGPNYFFIAMPGVVKQMYGFDVEWINYGKPERLTFDYAEQLLREKSRKQGTEISNFYMIGDNPASDIDGANRKGWTSFLVRTGVFVEAAEGPKHPATYIVDDFSEAIKMIYKLEGLD